MVDRLSIGGGGGVEAQCSGAAGFHAATAEDQDYVEVSGDPDRYDVEQNLMAKVMSLG